MRSQDAKTFRDAILSNYRETLEKREITKVAVTSSKTSYATLHVTYSSGKRQTACLRELSTENLLQLRMLACRHSLIKLLDYIENLLKERADIEKAARMQEILNKVGDMQFFDNSTSIATNSDAPNDAPLSCLLPEAEVMIYARYPNNDEIIALKQIWDNYYNQYENEHLIFVANGLYALYSISSYVEEKTEMSIKQQERIVQLIEPDPNYEILVGQDPKSGFVCFRCYNKDAAGIPSKDMWLSNCTVAELECLKYIAKKTEDYFFETHITFLLEHGLCRK